MANAARVHILEKGLDPRQFSMMAFGGAGPVHAFGVARLLHAPQLIIPVGAGVTSALGFLVSPLASEKIRSYVCRLEAMDWAYLNQMLQEMEKEGLAFLKRSGIPKKQATIQRIADMRYSGQGHEISVSIPNGRLTKKSIAEIERRFIAEYELRYSKSIPNMPMETVTWRVIVSGPSPSIHPQLANNQSKKKAKKGTRPVLFSSTGSQAIDCPVYDRYQLKAGRRIKGPAIIEETESTTVIGPDSRIQIDEFNNIVIDLK